MLGRVCAWAYSCTRQVREIFFVSRGTYSCRIVLTNKETPVCQSVASVRESTHYSAPYIRVSPVPNSALLLGTRSVHSVARAPAMNPTALPQISHRNGTATLSPCWGRRAPALLAALHRLETLLPALGQNTPALQRSLAATLALSRGYRAARSRPDLVFETTRTVNQKSAGEHGVQID
jgi:hypothetical protein